MKFSTTTLLALALSSGYMAAPAIVPASKDNFLNGDGFEAAPTNISTSNDESILGGSGFEAAPSNISASNNVSNLGGSGFEAEYDNITSTLNPFVGKDFYANSFYAGEIAKNPVSPDLAAAAEKIKTIQTAYWLDKAVKVPSLTAQFTEAMAKQKETGKKQVFLMVVYNLPNRDCSAGASAGEFSAADGGMEKYKAYIDAIAKQVAAFPDLQIAAIVEPALPNFVVTKLKRESASTTNLGVAKCKDFETVYKEGVAYTIKTLQMPNIALYLDLAHSGWFGSNRAPAAKLYAEVVKLSGGKIRGFSTNVANYNSVKDEASYVQAMAKEMTAVGLPANFVIDTGRNGAQNLRSSTRNWCNIKGAGFGLQPTAKTGIPNVDAFLWVKPGGESDGDSAAGATPVNGTCKSTDSVMPAPRAGKWFASYFADLIKNANPPIA